MKSVALLETLLDEVRFELQLAVREAKEGWRELESRIHAVQRPARETFEDARAALADAFALVKSLRDSLR